MQNAIYNSLLWQLARSRVLERDGSRCTVSRLLGGPCSTGPLHVHHIVRPEDGGDPYHEDNLGSVCARHHPKWEALRRRLAGELVEQPVRCPHQHRSAESRAICERRLARQRQHVAA